MQNYALEVCTEYQKESSLVRIGHKNCLIATNGSKFMIKLSNAGDTICDVKLYIGEVFIDCWRINCRETIKLKKHHTTQQEFSFCAEDAYSTTDVENNCRKTTIVGEFYPADSVDFFGDIQDSDVTEVCRIPDNNIHWEKVVKLQLDVIICNHHLE